MKLEKPTRYLEKPYPFHNPQKSILQDSIKKPSYLAPLPAAQSMETTSESTIRWEKTNLKTPQEIKLLS
jgi:hypothetical protein